MSENKNAPGAGHGARERGCLAGTAGHLNITQSKPSHQSASLWRVHSETGQPFTIEAPGRLGWALTVLCEAGKRGVAAAELPAGLRWSAYIHTLRKLGVLIWTTREPNAGPMGGHHARYRLGCRVEREGGQ